MKAANAREKKATLPHTNPFKRLSQLKPLAQSSPLKTSEKDRVIETIDELVLVVPHSFRVGKF